jgi:hypothetical protein
VIELLPKPVENPARPQLVTPSAVELSQDALVVPSEILKKASALATGLTATSNAVDPNTVTSVLFIFLSSSGGNHVA